MLRWGDCAALPVKVHPYIYDDDMEMSFEAIEWLLENSLSAPCLEALALNAIKTWAALEYGSDDASVVDDLIKNFSKYEPGEPRLSDDFLRSNAPGLKEAFDDADIEQNLALLKESLNDEFLRVRYGGLVDTGANSRELAFRISSSGKNWSDRITSFISEFGAAESITVVRDAEPFSNGAIQFYRSNSGIFFNKMPVDDFMRHPGELRTERNSILRNVLENQLFADLIENNNWIRLLDHKRILNTCPRHESMIE